MGFSILAKGRLKEGRKPILGQISRFTNYPGSHRDVRSLRGHITNMVMRAANLLSWKYILLNMKGGGMEGLMIHE